MDITQRLTNLAAFVIETAKKAGATDADVGISVNQKVSFDVRNGTVEETRGAGDRGLSFRVFVGDKVATASTADFQRRPVAQLVRLAVRMAKNSGSDPTASLPDTRYLATEFPTQLNLLCQGIEKLTVKNKLDMALATAEAAREASSLVTNAEAGFSDNSYSIVYANTRGFCQGYSGGSCALKSSAVVSKDGEMKTDYWWESGRSVAKLGEPGDIGRKATERALRQLGGRKIDSQSVPVVYDPQMAAQLLGQIAGALYGAAIQKKASFLTGKLDTDIASPLLTIIDDPFIVGGHGSKPFAAEGLAVRKRNIVNAGKLENYFVDAYSARKLGCDPNGGAATNLYVEKGGTSAADIIASVHKGLYLTKVSGPGFNSITGDYSRGATGMWIENGKLAYPVAGITVAGTVQQMLKGIKAVGDDLEYRSSVCSPTLLFEDMKVAGK